MKKLFSLVTAVAAILGVFHGNDLVAAEWGTLKGQIVLDGDIPVLKPIVSKGDQSAKDAAVCAAEEIPDEKFVVSPTTKGLANVVVYLQKKPSAIHPDHVKSAKPVVDFDQQGCRFHPHVLLVRTDQQVRVLSDDSVAHNTRTGFLKNQNENFTIATKDRTGVLLKPLKFIEKVPQPVKCDIHSFMQAYWVILDHPYAAVTDADGKFEIPDLPAEALTFAVWHEVNGYLKKEYAVTIKPGVNEPPALKFTAKQVLEK